MSQELMSAKYLSPEYFADDQAATEPENSGAPASEATRVSGGNWTSTMTAVTVFCGLIGTFGFFSGLAQITSLPLVAGSLEALKELPPSQELQATMVLLEAQLQYQPALYFCHGLQMLTGIGFLIGCWFLHSRRENANGLVATISVATIFYHVSITAVGGLMASSALTTLQQLELPAETVTQLSALAIVLTLAGLAFKLSIHGALIAFMSTKNSNALFASAESLDLTEVEDTEVCEVVPVSDSPETKSTSLPQETPPMEPTAH